MLMRPKMVHGCGSSRFIRRNLSSVHSRRCRFVSGNWVRVVIFQRNDMPPLSHPTQQVIDELIWQEDRFVVSPERQCRFEQLGIAKALPK
jgi:hypothetical protein